MANACESTPQDLPVEDLEAAVGAPEGFLMLRGLILPLSDAEDTVLGRDKSQCDIVLAHEHISKRHSSISYRDGIYTIHDLGSLNGTFVNGERVHGETPLAPGDEIRLPPYMMLFFGPEQEVSRTPRRRRGGLQTVQQASGSKKNSISGLLSMLSVSDVIQLVNFTTQSGELTVRTPDSELGVVLVSKGEIIQARFQGLLGEKALFDILAVQTGEFEFVQGDPEVPANRITTPTVTLLLEGAKRMDEHALQGNLNTALVQ